jgi:HPt (histidine-containing phosphotransfer) domain-containing protein
MDDVIAKPIERERLEAVIERYAPAVGTRTGRHVIRPRAGRATPGGAEVSLDRFREVTMGDATLARGLVESFGHGTRQACEDLESGLDRGDFALVKRAAHTLVGSSANMGAVRLEALAAAMEQAAAQADAVTLRPLVAATRLRCDAALAELKTLL